MTTPLFSRIENTFCLKRFSPITHPLLSASALALMLGIGITLAPQPSAADADGLDPVDGITVPMDGFTDSPTGGSVPEDQGTEGGDAPADIALERPIDETQYPTDPAGVDEPPGDLVIDNPLSDPGVSGDTGAPADETAGDPGVADGSGDGITNADDVIVEEPVGGDPGEGVDPGDAGQPPGDGTVNADDVIVEDPVGGDPGEGIDLGDVGEPQEDWVFDDWQYPVICACFYMFNVDVSLNVTGEIYTFEAGSIMMAADTPMLLAYSPLANVAVLRDTAGDPMATPIPGVLALLPWGLAAGAFLRRRR